MTEEQYVVFTPREGALDWLQAYRGQVGKILLAPDGTSRMYHLQFPDGYRVAAWEYEVESVDV